MKTIPLTQGKVALVDDADFEKVRGHTWCAHKIERCFYAATNIRKPDGTGTMIHMHCLLLPGSKRVDHKNGDGLDNQRKNLRAASNAENCRAFKRKQANTSSIYRGVRWHTLRQKWTAQLFTNKKQWHLGYFKKEQDAARAYDAAAKQFFGEFASPNFP